MFFQRLWAITLKEIRHIIRDRGTLFLVAFMPTLLLFLLAYALTADISHVPITVLDYDRTPTSRAFIQQIAVGNDLDLRQPASSWKEIQTRFLRGSIKAAIIIAPGFEQDLLAMRGMPLQVVIDGTEPQSGGFAVDHISSRAEAFASQVLSSHLQAAGMEAATVQPIDLRLRTWFNPDLKASADMIPGLISIVLGLPGMSIALALAKEREHGTLEQLLATPVGRGELLLGKILPYVLSGIINVPITTIVAMIWFHIPFHGSFWLYLGLSAIFFFALLSMGLLVGAFLHSQAAALALSMLVIFYPGFFLTGIFFPIASMPPIVRMESYSLPGTPYAIITRALFVTGVGWEVVWPYAAALLTMGVIFTLITIVFFKKKLG